MATTRCKLITTRCRLHGMSTTAFHIYVQIAQAHDVKVLYTHGTTTQMRLEAIILVKTCKRSMKCITTFFSTKYPQTHWNTVGGLANIYWHVTCNSKFMWINYYVYVIIIFGC